MRLLSRTPCKKAKSSDEAANPPTELGEQEKKEQALRGKYKVGLGYVTR